MDNENEFNYSPNNDFKQIPKKTKSAGFGKTVLLPFISGILGASAILATCLGVPSIKNKFFKVNTTTTETKEKSSSTSSNSKYNASLMDLVEYSETAVAVSEKALPSVVGITVTYNVASAFGGSSEATATGSGVIISEDGYIITNNHVINSESTSSYYQVTEATKIEVHLFGDSDDVVYDAKVIGSDKDTDLAVLKIEKEGLTAIEIGDSDNLRVGEFVMAMGNPLGLGTTVTAGIISALDREVSDNENNSYVTIQTDAAINSGNSGGALVNSKGELIGINSLKLSGSGIEGIGFAMPINSSMDIINQLIDHGSVIRPYIGITGSSITDNLSERYDVPIGVYVEEILKDGPAEKSDLKVGDIITEVNGTAVKSINDVNEIKNKLNIGDEITLKVYRDDKYEYVKLTLAETPAEEEESKEDTTTSSIPNDSFFTFPFGF